MVLPIQRFGSILRESSDEKLHLESDGTRDAGPRPAERVPVAHARTPTSFPRFDTFEEEQYHEMPARFFRELVRRTVFATDTESSRYALGGVLLELGAKGIIGVGTDGRRLARQEGPGRSGRRARDGGEHGHPHPGDATDRTGAGRQRRRDPIGRPRERRSGEEPADHDLQPAGRRPLSQVARRVSQVAEDW